MRIGQGLRTGLGHGGITCVLQTQFSSFFSSCFFLSCTTVSKDVRINMTFTEYCDNLSSDAAQPFDGFVFNTTHVFRSFHI